MVSQQTTPLVSSRAGVTFGLCSLAVFLVTLDTTILFGAFHEISASFPTVSSVELSWILNAYTIVFGALLVPAGRFADLYGRKKLFLCGVALFNSPREQSNKSLHSEHTPFIKCPDASSRASRSAAG